MKNRSGLFLVLLIAWVTIDASVSPGWLHGQNSEGVSSRPDISERMPEKPENLRKVLRNGTPRSLDDIKAIERAVQVIMPGVSSAVVAVQVRESTGSGVVITKDGVVLTAAHVCDEPDREVRFTFPDGKTARGKTLGTNHKMDAGMMKITDDGPWPHVELGDLADVHLGDWVLTLGHPGGFDPRRSLVARLGRVIRVNSEVVQTDCTLSAGDSGGPLFDLRGAVIGIHSQISESTAENFHVPVSTYRDTWDRLAKGENWGDERFGARPWFGVRGADHPAGCKLEFVEEDAPAFKAGLKAGDIVCKVNSRDVKDYAALKRLVAEARPGEELTVELQRDEKPLSLTVKLEARRWRR